MFSLSVQRETNKRREAENSRRLLTVRSMKDQTRCERSRKVDRLLPWRAAASADAAEDDAKIAASPPDHQRVEDNSFHLFFQQREKLRTRARVVLEGAEQTRSLH